MERYIDADQLKAWLKTIPIVDLSDGLGFCRVIFVDKFENAIKNIPSESIVDVAPVRHGEWEQLKNHEENFDFRCSACHKFRFHNGELSRKYNYCPNCGAKMDGVTDGK